MMVKPCSTKGAFNAIPETQMKIDFEEIKKIKELEMVTFTPYLVVVKIDGTELVIYPSGKLLIKTNDKKVAEKIAEKIYKLI
jgi:ribonuclease HIII